MIYELYENEVVMLLIGMGVLVFILGNRERLKRLPASKILILAFYIMLAGWVMTVLEGLFGLFLEEILNFAEHLCTAISSIFVAVWCCKVFGVRDGRKRDSAFADSKKEAV
jgi:hypothetical protein